MIGTSRSRWWQGCGRAIANPGVQQCFGLKILTLTGCTPHLVVFLFILILSFSLMFFIHWLWVVLLWLLAVNVPLVVVGC